MADTEHKQMQIVDSYLALNALREVGYRNTATAIAELVDNSIEAEADDIFVITQSKMDQGNKRASYRVQKIAVLDNGDGMAASDLASCLSLGWGTRLNTRKGLGRFGFGLKGASISQAKKIEVFSWQNGKCFCTYLDLDEVRDNKQQMLHPVEPCEIPSLYRKTFAEAIGDSGTLIIWSKLDGVDFTRPTTLLRRMENELCRLYRHFLDDDDTYGRKRNIVMHDYDLETDKIKASTKLTANDPLYLLEPSIAPGAEGRATNILFEKPYKIDIEYAPGKSSEIEIRLSIAKPEVQALNGNSALGKHYAQNAGISFVRAGREIDFGPFGFINPSEARNRWWGVEVRFSPELDELFGVTNNKQQIRGFRKLDPRLDGDFLETLKESAEDEDTDGRYKAKLLLDLNHNLSQKISSMMTVITNRAAGSKGPKPKPSEPDPVVDTVNDDVSNDTTETSSETEAAGKSEAEKLAERIKLLLDTRPELDKDQRERLAQATLDYKVDLKKEDWPGNTFLDIQMIANAAVGVINTRSPYYQKFWQHLEDADDEMGIRALEIFTMAYVRTEDELRRTHDGALFEQLRDRWGFWVSKLLKHVGE